MSVTRAASKLPSFITDLGREPGAAAALVAASLALFAVGLDPKVLSPGLPDAQAALRERPSLEGLFLLSALIQAAFLLVGGVFGDALGRRRVLLFSLSGLAIAEVGAILMPSGPGFLAARLLAAATSGTVLPVALAVIAVTYNGPTRATALGMAYGALGAATAIAPPVLIAVTPTIGRWPSFALAAVVLLIALWAVRRSVPHTAPSGLPLRAIAPHALWAFGLLSLIGGLIGFRGASESLIRAGLIVIGAVLVGTFLLVQRRRKGEADDYSIDFRPTTIALLAGFVLVVAQVAPMLELPLFFQISQQYSPLLATVALTPFILALLVAGPLAGALLTRYSPRTLIVGGLVIVGLGDLLLAFFSGPSTSYLFFIVPFFAVGAGFVVGTSVRTAVIFASVTRKLPATAAALNQSSFVVGGQAGVAGITALVTSVAISTFAAGVPAGLDPASAVEGFRTFMLAIGTSEFGQVIDQLPASTTLEYGVAFAAGVQYAMALVGLIAVATAVLVWFAMAGQAPIETVWEHREERPGRTEPAPEAEPASA